MPDVSRRPWGLVMFCAGSWLCGCTGDPSAPDIYSYRHRHDARMVDAARQRDDTRGEAANAALDNRGMERERDVLLRSVGSIQDELRAAKAKVAKIAAAERERLLAEARRLQSESESLADAARADARRLDELKARKERLGADVTRLRAEIEKLSKLSEDR